MDRRIALKSHPTTNSMAGVVEPAPTGTAHLEAMVVVVDPSTKSVLPFAGSHGHA